MVAPLDAEFSVIGALLLEPKIAGELFSITSEQDFTREELHNVYPVSYTHLDVYKRQRSLQSLVYFIVCPPPDH